MTFKQLYRWAIEVDPNRNQPNLAAQVALIRTLAGDVYDARPDSPLQKLRYVYFTRIFSPERDNMGTYVRLHFFVSDDARPQAEAELDTRLGQLRQEGAVFQVHKEAIPGLQEAVRKGAGLFPELYYGYMEFLSRTAIELFEHGISDSDFDKILWEWTHNLFNLLRGYQVSVLEFPPDIPVRSWRI